MTAALLLSLLRRHAGKVIVGVGVPVAVVIFLTAVMGFVDWKGALALWLILGVVAFVHAGSYDVGEDGEDR